jgi:serine/threonine protein kinase/Flp pilus assembly protein TadD
MTAPSRSLKELFLAALEVAPADRAAWLQRECAADAGLREHLGLMLAAHDAPQSLLDRPAGVDPLAGGAPPGGLGLTIDEPPAEAAGTVIGPYKLMEQIGEGGMGLVFVAEQQQPIRRKVALKVIKPGMDTRQVVARFEAERQALALMDHPNIAHVHDGGTTPTGRPYFVMELVKGVPITEYCDQNQVPVRERLGLLLDVCQAVQHAHQKGIIHRDIKPSNVLVMSRDGTPVVKVIDFGVAKAVGQQLTDKTIYTQFTQLVGTPLYMSPEQAGHSGIGVDTRTDIYALGVLLYELLTGMTPFDKERLKGADYDEIRRIIREEEPPRPSTRLSTLGQAATTVSTRRKSDPRRLTQLVRGDLDWIVMKALEKDRNRRYETASALAADVQRYLADEPVEATPPSAGYRLRKLLRRHKGAVLAAALLLLAAVLAGAGLGWMAGERAARRDRMVQAFDAALQEGVEFLQAGNEPRARAAVQRASGLLTGAGGDKVLHERLDRVTADLEMVADIEWARLQGAEVKDGTFSYFGAEPFFARAFRRYNLPVLQLDRDEAVRRIAASAIREQILAALAEWNNRQRDPAEQRKLMAVLRSADENPWRQGVYGAVAQRDLAGLARLSEEPQALDQPPARLEMLSRFLAKYNRGAAVNFLHKAQQRYPDDFWINHELAFYLCELKPPRSQEAIGFYRAALALRPNSPGVHLNLGLALQARGDFTSAETEIREAIRLQPEYVEAHNSLGSVLYDGKHDYDGAAAEFRWAVDRKPDEARYHFNLGLALNAKGEQDFDEAHHNAKGQFDGAMREFRRAMDLGKDDADTHTDLGVALGRAGRLPSPSTSRPSASARTTPCSDSTSAPP